MNADAAVLYPDGAASLIRIMPDIDTIAAVLGAWAYGYTPSGAEVTFWGLMPQVLIGFEEPHGDGVLNRLAGDVYAALTGKKFAFAGPILAVNEGAAAFDEAVCKFAAHVRTLRSPVLSQQDEWEENALTRP